MSDRTFNLASGEVARDPTAGSRGFESAELGRRFDAMLTGLTVYAVPPGEAVWPYHFELHCEEWLIVVEGTPTLRTPDGERLLGPGDVVCFRPGPGGAHAIRNDSDAPVRFAMPSTIAALGYACVYPDSDKVKVVGPDFERVFALGEELDYWVGEQ